MELSKTKAAIYASLSQKKMRQKHSLFIVEGEKSVADTAGLFIPEALISSENWISGNKEIVVKFPKDKVYSASETLRKKISSLSNVPEVMAVYRLPSSAICDFEKEVDAGGLNLLLDGIQDPGNLGTIIRTAHWFGVKKIFASQDTVDLYNPKTLQSTMGSIAKVKVYYCDLLKLIEKCPDIPVYGTLLDGKDIYCASLSKKGFIVMGNEGKGISEPLRKKITDPLLIPPYDNDNHSESLNVAIATGIVLSQFRDICKLRK